MSQGTTFDLARQDKFVRDHSDKILIAKGIPCGCGTTEDMARVDPDCQACGGYGTRYGPDVTVRAMVLGMRSEKALLQAGIAMPGDMILSLSPFEKVRVGDWDRVRLTWLDGQPYQGDLVKRRPYGPDRLIYEPKKIDSITQVEPRTGQVTTFPSSAYTLEGRKITWVGDPQPARETVYAVAYAVKTYDWVVFVSPMDRYEKGVSLGQKALLRRRHVVKARYSDTPF